MTEAEVRAAALLLASKRRPVEKACARCGQTFTAQGRGRYCKRPECRRARKLEWWRQNRSTAARQRQEERDDG